MALIDDIISYWKLDESSGNAEDSHSTNDLTNNNSTPFVTGKINNGADLEAGSSQSFSIADGSQSGLDIVTDFSISFWFKPESLPTEWYPVAKLAGSNGYRIECGSTLLRIVYGAGSAVEINQAGFWEAGDIGNWVHVVITVDVSARSAVVYKNGSSVGTPSSGSGDTSIAGSTANFYLGARSDGTLFADGVMDEVGIWSRILTAGEVTSLYGAGNGLSYPFGATYTTELAKGAYTLTGKNINLFKEYVLNALKGLYVLTGKNVDFIKDIYINQTKSSSTFSNMSKNSSSFNNQSKNNSSWINNNKS